MIQINESRNYMQEKSCPAYLGKPLFDINKNIFKFPTKKPKYKFYPQRTLPIHGNDCLSTCEAKNGVFLASYNNTDFRYIDDEIIRFKINNKAHAVKMLGKQVFLASKTHLYSYHDHTYQSLSLNSICMDTMELTNEVVFLQNDRIRFLHGEEYELSCNDPKGIYFTDHPKNVILTTTKCIYHIDLRTEKPNFVMNSGGDITKLIQTKNNYIVQFNTGFTVFDKYFGHNEYTSMYLSNSFQVMSNDNEIIAHSATVFKYFDINNLSVNSTIQHDIADFIGFATQNDRHYFFRDHCIDEFDSKGKIRSIGCQFKDTQGKQKTTIFFDNDFCQNRRCEEYRIVNDYNVDKYDEFMDLVKNENDEQSIPKIEKTVQKKRVKRAAGF